MAYLRDRGVDTSKISARIRNATARKIDKAEGKRLLAAREET